MLGSGLLVAGLAAGCKSTTGASGPGKPSPSASKAPPKLVNIKGTVAPELTPDPSDEDLAGGPDWTAPDLTGKTLTLWGLNYDPHVQRYKLLASMFNKATGATVKVQPQDDPQKQILTAMAGKNVPDVICLMGKMSDQLVRRKGLLALDDDVYSDLKIDMDKWWMPDAIGAYTWSGKHYGVPVEGSGTGFSVTGRTDLITKAGTSAASLWPGSAKEAQWPDEGVYFDSYDQMYELAKELQHKVGKKVKIWGQNRQGWETQALTGLLYQQGVTWWDAEKEAFDLDNEACVKAIQTMVTTPYGKGIESKLAVGNVVNGFVAGQVALGIGNTSAAGEGVKVKIAGENVIAPSIVPGKQPVFMGEGGWGFEVPAQGKQIDLALEFMRFLTTYEAQFTWSQIYGGFSPACKALQNSAIYAGNTALKRGQRRILVSLQNTHYQGNGYDPQCEGLVTQIVDQVRTGKMNAADASKEMQKQLTEQQKRYAV